jgi:hypothetical protein
MRANDRVGGAANLATVRGDVVNGNWLSDGSGPPDALLMKSTVSRDRRANYRSGILSAFLGQPMFGRLIP